MPQIAITVLMPVYNAEKHLSEAIDSIIKQTYSEFEFLIINDGSTDGSDKIIRSYTDERIIYIHNTDNKGIVESLNEGLRLSRGKYIARMDADDVADPRRLELQLTYLQANPDCQLCGSLAIAINETGNKLNKLKRPLKNEDIKAQQLFRNCFIHPTVIISKRALNDFQYEMAFQYAEDYLLFSQIALKYEVNNLENQLLYYRIHDENITTSKKLEMEASERKVIRYVLKRLLGDSFTEDHVALHHRIIRREFANIDRREFEDHLLLIKEANDSKNLYPSESLGRVLQMEWFNFLRRSNAKQLVNFISSPLFSITNINFKQLFKLAIS